MTVYELLVKLDKLCSEQKRCCGCPIEEIEPNNYVCFKGTIKDALDVVDKWEKERREDEKDS